MTNRGSTSTVYPRSRLVQQRNSSGSNRGISSTTAAVTTHRPLHLERENSKGIEEVGLPWRGGNNHKVQYTMRDVDSSESPPPPPPPLPPPALVPRTLTLLEPTVVPPSHPSLSHLRHGTTSSTKNNTDTVVVVVEQDERTEHTVKSVSDLVHKFESKIRRVSSKKKQPLNPTSANTTTAKSSAQSPTTKKYYYKGSGDETSEISDDDDDEDDITALSVSEKTKFFEHLSALNKDIATAVTTSSSPKNTLGATVPHFQTKFIHAALRSQLLRSSTTAAGALGKIPPLQQHILSMQVINNKDPLLTTTTTSTTTTNKTTGAAPRDYSLPQPQLHRRTSEQTSSSIIVDIHSPLKQQLRKNHYERIYKRSKRQLQKYANTTDDDISSLTVPSFPDKKENTATTTTTTTQRKPNIIIKNSAQQQQRYLNTTTAKNDTDDPCNPYTGSPLDEKETSNLQQQRRQNYYELIAYAESLKEIHRNRAKKEYSSKNVPSHEQQEQAETVQKQQINTASSSVPLLVPSNDVQQHREPVDRRIVSQSEQEEKDEHYVTPLPLQGTVPEENQQHMKLVKDDVSSRRNGSSLTEKKNLYTSQDHYAPSTEAPQYREPLREESLSSNREPPSFQKIEPEGDQDRRMAPSIEPQEDIYYTPTNISRKTLYVVPSSDFPSDAVSTPTNNGIKQCPESPAPSDEAAANDSSNGDAPSDEKQMPRLSKFIPQQRISNPNFAMAKENVPVPKNIDHSVAAGRKKRLSFQEPTKSVEKSNSTRKKRDERVLSSVALASSTSTKRQLRSVPVAPTEPSIRSRVQTFNEKRDGISRMHNGLPPRKPRSSANDDPQVPDSGNTLHVKGENLETFHGSTTQLPTLPVKESREFQDDKKVPTQPISRQEFSYPSQLSQLAAEDVKVEISSHLPSESTKSSNINSLPTDFRIAQEVMTISEAAQYAYSETRNYKYADVVSRQENKTTMGKSNFIYDKLQNVRKGSSETLSKVSNIHTPTSSNEGEQEKDDELKPESEEKCNIDDEDEEICSITMRITRDAKVGPQVGVSISEYGTGSVEVSRLDTPTIQKVANLVLRRNLEKKSNESSPIEGEESTDQNVTPEKHSKDALKSQTSSVQKKMSKKITETKKSTQDKETKEQNGNSEKNSSEGKSLSASLFSEATCKSDIKSHPWRKPGEIHGQKTLGGISAVSVCSSPSSEEHSLGISRPAPASNDCFGNLPQTHHLQDSEKSGVDVSQRAFQGRSKRSAHFSSNFSTSDDSGWTLFSGNDAFTLSAASSSSAQPPPPPPPPKDPHPSQLVAASSEVAKVPHSFPVVESQGLRTVSRSPQPSTSSTSTSDFTLRHMRQSSQSPKENQSRSSCPSPETSTSIPPPPPIVPHVRVSTFTPWDALKNDGSRSVSRSPQPSTSSTINSGFTLRHMRQTSLSPKSSRLRSGARSPQSSPLRTESFDPFSLQPQTRQTSQSPKNSRQRSVSRSSQRNPSRTDDAQQHHIRNSSQSPKSSKQPSQRNPLFTDDFDQFAQHPYMRPTTQSPKNIRPRSVSLSSQSSTSNTETFDPFALNPERTILRSPPKYLKNGLERTSRSVSRSPDPSLQPSVDGYRRSSRTASRSPDSDRSLTAGRDTLSRRHFRGLASQSPQASSSSKSDDDAFTLRRMVSHSPRPSSVSSSATSDTFTLRNMRSVSSSPTPSIPRLDLSREENDEIRKILTQSKSSRHNRHLSLSPEKSTQASAASSQVSSLSPPRLSPTIVSAFEDIDFELSDEVERGIARKVTFDNQVKVRSFISDPVTKSSTLNTKKPSKFSKWTSKMCRCFRSQPIEN